MQTFVVPLAGAVLGARKGTIAVIVYLLLGAVGVPVFAGFSGGVHTFVGPWGGYLWAFPLFAFIVGFASDRGKLPLLAVGLVIGAALTLTMGMLQFAFHSASVAQAPLDMRAAFMACVVPFIIPDFIKIFMVFIIAPKIRQTLEKFSGNPSHNTRKST